MRAPAFYLLVSSLQRCSANPRSEADPGARRREGSNHFFDVHDGLGVFVLGKLGIKTILITAKGSKAIGPRARDMGVAAVFENVIPKSVVLDRILKKYAVTTEQICFVGDDLVDLCLMKKVGFPVAVFNACPEIKQAASYITLREGGRGAVREITEVILKSQGKWEEALKIYDV